MVGGTLRRTRPWIHGPGPRPREDDMRLTRRGSFGLAAGAAAFVTFGTASTARAAYSAEVEAVIAEFTRGVAPGEGGLRLIAPEIAENGNAVPVEVWADGAEAILLLATGNPQAEGTVFHFGPLAGAAAAGTRIRLAQTQDVVAVARFPDGRATLARAEVKVTIGGCGG